MGNEVDDGGPTGLKNPITLARLLVVAAPLFLLLVAGIVYLAKSDLFASFQPSPQIEVGFTTEAALARDIEREARVLDVISILMDDTGVYLWIVDSESGTLWNQSEQDGVNRSFGVIFKYVRDRDLETSITFFRIVRLKGIDGEVAEVFQGVVQFYCPAELVAEYDGDPNVIANACTKTPDGLFIDAEAELLLLGR